MEIASGMLMSVEEACGALSVSEATIKNWVRLGKLFRDPNAKQSLLFPRSEIDRILRSIEAGESSQLKSRRNKTKIKGMAAIEGYIENQENIASVKKTISCFPDGIEAVWLRHIMANFALQLILEKRQLGSPKGPCIESYLKGDLEIGPFKPLVDDLINDGNEAETPFAKAIPEAYSQKLSYIEGEDALGFAYISMSCIGGRKAQGAYYTPSHIAKGLVESLDKYISLKGKKVLDPCCGSGNFLLLLAPLASPENVYGADSDPIAAYLARISFALAFNITDYEFLKSHIAIKDSLSDDFDENFDAVAGNPPWGAGIGKEGLSRLSLKYKTAKAAETSSLFIEFAIGILKEGGMMAFVLPESILNVRGHQTIRDLLRSECNFKFAHYLGNAFSGVNCPSIVLGAQKSASHAPGASEVRHMGEEYPIASDRQLSNGALRFHVKDESQDAIDAMDNCLGKATLEGSKFALGIVTGDNKSFVSPFCEDGYEPVLKGSDIQRFRHRDAMHFIKYEPRRFQQAAPIELYRAKEKLFYRFVSECLVFSYDDAQTISINSCNVLIPMLEGFDIKYTLALLNSSAATFYFICKFPSLKVLKGHIEKIPLPKAGCRAQEKAIGLVNSIIYSRKEPLEAYMELDDMIFGLYGFTSKMRQAALKAIGSRSLFLPS